MKYFFLLFPILNYSQNIYIPDPVLKNYFVGTYGYHIDFNNDGEVSQAEALTLNSFNAGYFYGIGGIGNISDFTGLEYFTNLQSVQIVLNLATSLNLNNLTNLKTLQITGASNSGTIGPPIYYSPIVNLNLAGCVALEQIYLNSSSVQNLDLTTNVALKEFYSNYSKLENINFSGLSHLERVEIENAMLLVATFNGNSALNYLRIIYQPDLHVLDLTGATSLIYIDAHDSGIDEMHINNLSNLKQIDCYNNQIPQLNLAGLTSLEQIHCEFNQIDKLDFSDANNVVLVYCSNNLIEDFTVSPQVNNRLAYVDCSFNQIRHLDFSDLGNEFKSLDCRNNLLEDVHVQGTDLRGMNCSNNNLTSLDLEWVQNLEGIDCTNNQINSINMKHVIANPYDNIESMSFENNPLMYACVDDFQVDHYKNYFSAKGMNGVDVSSTCEFAPMIYPNPIGSVLNIRSGSKIDSFNIYDMNGRLVYSTPVNATNYSNSISEIQTGVYVLEVVTNNQSKMVKIIKN